MYTASILYLSYLNEIYASNSLIFKAKTKLRSSQIKLNFVTQFPAKKTHVFNKTHTYTHTRSLSIGVHVREQNVVQFGPSHHHYILYVPVQCASVCLIGFDSGTRVMKVHIFKDRFTFYVCARHMPLLQNMDPFSAFVKCRRENSYLEIIEQPPALVKSGNLFVLGSDLSLTLLLHLTSRSFIHSYTLSCILIGDHETSSLTKTELKICCYCYHQKGKVT